MEKVVGPVPRMAAYDKQERTKIVRTWKMGEDVPPTPALPFVSLQPCNQLGGPFEPVQTPLDGIWTRCSPSNVGRDRQSLSVVARSRRAYHTRRSTQRQSWSMRTQCRSPITRRYPSITLVRESASAGSLHMAASESEIRGSRASPPASPPGFPAHFSFAQHENEMS